MKSNRRIRSVVVALCVGSLMSPAGTRASELSDNSVGNPSVQDVALDASGNLRGTLVTADGKPQAKIDVLLRKGQDVVGVTKTQADGKFLIRQVKPGMYELSADRSVALYRVWAEHSAPPAARSAVLLVQGGVVRGQQWSPIRRGLILGGVVITSGVIGGVIGYNIKDDAS